MKKKQLYLLAGIVFLAFFLRIFKVASIPPSLSWDEVSIGYNAYSILKTGLDEHRKFLPIDTFVAFGDYKPPLAIYATVLPIAVFGLNEFAVRFPSVIAGTFAVFITFFLVKELLKKLEFSKTVVMITALVTSFILAISPWHIQLSRAGFEANIAVSLILLGAWLSLKARDSVRLLLICWIPFVAAIYTFNSARYFVPLLGLAILVYCWQIFRKHYKELIIGLLLSGLLLLPIIPHLISPEARLRFTEVNIFSDLSVIESSNERIAYDGNSTFGKIIHNRRIMFARSYLKHFFDHFDPGFLFIRGDGNPKFSIQDVGELYLVELPFLILGLYWFLVKDSRTAILLIAWLVVAILPAATARETPHALRIENSLPTWQIFIAFGIINVFLTFRRAPWRQMLIGGIVLLYAMNFLYYLNNYYAHYAKEFSGEWQYGYREAIEYIKPIKSSYDFVVMTESIGRPYAYVLFYERFDPQQFWRTADTSFDAAGFYHVYGFEKYRFVRDSIGSPKSRTLYVLDPANVPAGVRILKTINLLNGNPILVIFDKP